MFIMAIDQSSTATGITIGELNKKDDDWKLIHHELYKPKGSNFDDKMLNLCDYLHQLIMDYDIEILVMEDVYALRNVNTLKKLASMMGAIKELANINQIIYRVVSASSWHTILNCKNNRRELKQSAKEFVLNKFGLEVSDDEADSICILTYFMNESSHN